jgi:hypothetical protein
MHIGKTTKFTGVDCAIPVIANMLKKRLVVLLPFKDPDTKRNLNVRFVDLRPSTRFN